MASFTVEACWNHWKALLRILGYVGRTIHHGITYGGNNEHAQGVEGSDIDYYSIDHNIEGHVGSAGLQDGEAFSDTDYATDPRDRKSILGFIFMVYGGAVMTYSKKMKSVARSTTEAEVIQPQEDVRLRQPISAQEFMRGTDFAADFSAIDPQLRFKDISVDNITEIHATTYAAKALKAYTLEKMWDDEVFHAFQQDFEGWTLDMFLMVEISYRRELRRFPTWDPEEFTKQIFDVRSNASWQQQALATPSSRENIQNPTQDQSPRDQPTTQAQALQQQQQVVSQGPQRPPEQAQQMTPRNLIPSPIFPGKLSQDIPTQQTQTNLTGISRTRPCPSFRSNERLDPAVSAQFLKTFDKDQKYTGEPYDLLDDKMKIFSTSASMHRSGRPNSMRYFLGFLTDEQKPSTFITSIKTIHLQ
ncbi:hypothetical protein HRG_009755 [Hirsutella rhossiliensis]|uniref:Uncharacterized protein n=1 Tax=Hirsutella rhossiliensis TaxID=111463 RepID=A0A9P8MRS7_9HYPO|nr:uncharacterized protein HRG_09755 [Hirsutella rhossiliensis]KAH0959294.1 hypothetical protein HRG_09755 [Hirsutella rhossiliensis]